MRYIYNIICTWKQKSVNTACNDSSSACSSSLTAVSSPQCYGGHSSVTGSSPLHSPALCIRRPDRETFTKKYANMYIYKYMYIARVCYNVPFSQIGVFNVGQTKFFFRINLQISQMYLLILIYLIYFYFFLLNKNIIFTICIYMLYNK